MFRNLTAVAVCAVLLAGPAIAMTPDMASKGSIAASQADTGAIHRAHRISVSRSTRGNREVNALNALEAAGYRQFDNLHADGRDFVATAHKAGKSYDVTITPSGAIQASNA